MRHDSSGPLSASRGLLWFERLLRLMTVVFAVGTIVFAATFVALVSGSGGVGVDATLEPPLAISLDDGQTIALEADGQAEDRALDIEQAELRAKVRLGEDDIDARVVVALSGVALITVFWIALLTIRRIVRSARKGNPFDGRNVFRLRVLAALFVLVPVGSEVGRRLLSSTVDADARLEISTGSPDWGVFLLVALGLWALAEVFSEGVALRDLDETTI